jgi:transglutaminase/protease-like cytokinesis protein 3
MTNRKLFLSFILIFEILSLGCQKTTKSQSRGLITDINSKAQMECFDRLKLKMKTNKLNFDISVSDNMKFDFSKANDDLNSLEHVKAEYGQSLNAKTNKTDSLEISRSDKKNIDSTFSLNAVEEKSPDFFKYEVSLDQNSETSYTEITQEFNVDSHCIPRLKYTSIERTTIEGNKLHHTETSLNPGDQAGSYQNDENDFIIPPNYIFADSMFLNIDTKEDLKNLMEKNKDKQLFEIMDSIVPVEVSASIATSHYDPFLQKITDFDTFSVKTKDVDMNATFAFSKNSKFKYMQIEDLEKWDIDEKLWDNATLVFDNAWTNEVITDLATFNSPGLSKVQIMSNREYNYKNLLAYWQPKEILGESGDWKFNQIFLSTPQELPPNSDLLVPLGSKRDAHPYLQKSKLVQVDAPEVQTLIKTLDPFLGVNRIQMALRIAQLVNDQISYDYESVKQEEIYPLSTTDVLARKKGVCQHFANLFAAIARGVGLPAKIIIGFMIDQTSAGAHAWNEIEIADGVWLPIEPQSRDLLIDSGRYLPLTAPNLLETGNISSEDLKMGLFKFKFTLLNKVSEN